MDRIKNVVINKSNCFKPLKLQTDETLPICASPSPMWKAASQVYYYTFALVRGAVRNENEISN